MTTSATSNSSKPFGPAAEKGEDWKERLLLLPTVEERLRYLMDTARKAPELPEEKRVETRRIEGCMSNVWLDSRMEGNACVFESAAEAVIPRALTVLLCDVYSHCPPDSILSSPPDFIDDSGLSQFLSTNRTNALGLVYGRMCAFAKTAQG